MNNRKRQRIAEEAAELLTRVVNVLPERVQAMYDGMVGWPAGISYENDRSSGHGRVIIWCDEHERELFRCHGEQMVCAGAVINPPTDLTGESGIVHDRAAEDLKGVDAHLRLIHHQVDLLAKRLTKYQKRSATPQERQETLGDADSSESCRWCAELEVAPGVRRYAPVWKNLRVDDGALVPMCRFCGDYYRDTGRKPSRQERESHHRGERVTRRSA